MQKISIMILTAEHIYFVLSVTEIDVKAESCSMHIFEGYWYFILLSLALILQVFM